MLKARRFSVGGTVARTVLGIRPWRVQMAAPRFCVQLSPRRGAARARACKSLRGYPFPGAPKERAALVHLAVSSALGCAGGGGGHEPLGFLMLYPDAVGWWRFAPPAPRRSRGGRADASESSVSDFFFVLGGRQWVWPLGHPFPGAPKTCAAPVHPAVSSALGCAGGGGHEPPGVASHSARLQDSAAFLHVAATSTREVAAGRVAVDWQRVAPQHRAESRGEGLIVSSRHHVSVLFFARRFVWAK